MQAAPDVGMLLPCNVVVRGEAPDCLVVGFLDPHVMVNLNGKPEVNGVADARMAHDEPRWKRIP